MVETPDNVQPLKPQYCTSCGHKFNDHQFVIAGRRQVIDIPPIKSVVAEYQVFEAQCTCGHKTTAQYSTGVKKPVSYGDNILTLVSYLSTRQYMPVARILATLLCIHKNRVYKAISEIMPEGFANTTLLTDCWPAYFKEPDIDHQLCLAHLMRDLIYLGQLYPKNNWSPRLLGLIQNAMAAQRQQINQRKN